MAYNKDVFDLIKNHLGKMILWNSVADTVQEMCSFLYEPNNEKESIDVQNKILNIKNYLIGQGFAQKAVDFLDEELEKISKIKDVSIYQETDDQVPDDAIAFYTRNAYNTEGMCAIPDKFSWVQLKKLTNEVYKRTGLVKFYVSNERTIAGKIVGDVYPTVEEVPVAYVLQTTSRNDEFGDYSVTLLGDYKQKNQKIVREISLPFRIYNFITAEQKQYFLFVDDKTARMQNIRVGDYTVTGVVAEMNDDKLLTATSRLRTKMPFLFAQKIENRITRFSNADEFIEWCKKIGINKETFFDYPFTFKDEEDENKIKKLWHPTWFKWLIWAFLLHREKGLLSGQRYPMHLLIIGKKDGGKSTLLNVLHAKSKEGVKVVSGGSANTLKALIPSFKQVPAKPGFLATSDRFLFIDEFFRILQKDKQASDMANAVALMNDLLEHQSRTASSGVSSVDVTMTARVLAATNPLRGQKTIEDLLKDFDDAWLSRWLIYFQSDEHREGIKTRRKYATNFQVQQYDFSEDDFLAAVDFMQSFHAELDEQELNEIFEEPLPIFSTAALDFYKSRHEHHLRCLADGVVKTRCLMQNSKDFKANKKDYEIIREIWHNIISSWTDYDEVSELPAKVRIYYLPESAKYIYRALYSSGPIASTALRDSLSNKLSTQEFVIGFDALRRFNLIEENRYGVVDLVDEVKKDGTKRAD